MKKKPDLTFLTRHWQLKLLSLIIGAGLWYFVVGQDQVDMIVNIPLEMRNLPADLVIANQYKNEIEVALSGPRRLIQEMQQQNVSRPVDLTKAEPGALVIKNDAESIALPRGIVVQRVQPANITLLVDRLMQKNFAITPVTRGKPSPGFVLESLTLNPPQITVTGPQSILQGETGLKTAAIALDGLDRSSTLQVHLTLSDAFLKLIGETMIEANVVLKEIMVRKIVRGIPVNIKDSAPSVKITPAVVTVEAEIPEQIVQETPELTMLFRAAASVPAARNVDEIQVLVTGVTLPGHAPIVILDVTPDKVRLLP